MGVIYDERGEVISSFTDKNANASDDRWLFQTNLTEPGDTQIVEKNQHAGFASRAPAGSKLIVSKISNSYRVSVAEYDNIVNDDLEEGEARAYSSAGGQIVCEIHFKNDGNIEISAPVALTITAPLSTINGDLEVGGTIDATGNISSEADVVADSAGSAITQLTHYHQGNLGFPTGAAIISGGGTAPGTPPVAEADGSITDGLGINSKTHVHPGVMAGGDSTGQAT